MTSARLVAPLLATALLWSALPIRADHTVDREPNDSCAEAGPITPGYHYGTMSPGDVDVYAVPATQYGTVAAQMNDGYQLEGDFDLYLYDPDCQVLDSSTHGGIEFVSAPVTRTATYYVAVVHASGGGTYDISVIWRPNDPGPEDGGDAPDAPACVTPITEGGHFGSLPPGDNGDCYQLQVPPLSRVTVWMTPEWCVDFDLELWEGGQVVRRSLNGGCETDYVTCFAIAGGTYGVRVYKFAGNGGYSLSIAMDELGVGDPFQDLQESCSEVLRPLAAQRDASRA